MEHEIISILTILELRLCLSVAGFPLWDDLPLVETEEPLQQRFVNGFLRLIRSGLFCAKGTKYSMEPRFLQRINNIGSAEHRFCVWKENMIVAFLYQKGTDTVAVLPELGRPGLCKIAVIHGSDMESMCEFVAMMTGTQENLMLNSLDERKQLELDGLRLFLGNENREEEKD